MDRNALLLYLQNVRDLKVAKYWLQVQCQKEKRKYDNQIWTLQKTNLYELPMEPSGSLETGTWCVLTVFFLICTILIFIVRGDSVFLTLCLWIVLILTAVSGIGFAIYRKKDQDEREEYETKYYRALNHNKYEEERVKKNGTEISALKAKWNDRAAWYRQERQKLDDLLNEFYGMNIIPVQFRMLSAVCYIYDYMSTSRESLTTALFDQRLEDGIRRLEAKMDSIISNLEEMVYEARCIRQNSERMMAQNNHMLESLQRTESNTLQAAQYAELSANYSRANAYFSLATYLKN